MIMTKHLVSQCREFLKTLPYSLLPPESNRLDQLVPALIEVLTNESNEDVLKEAVRLLGMIGPLALPSIPTVVALIAKNPITPTEEEIRLSLDRNQPWVCGWATWEAMSALERISPRKAIEEMGKLCHDPDPQVRFRAVLTLEKIREPSDEVIPRLVEMLRDEEVKIRREVVLTLWRYPGLGENILDALLSLTTDEDPLVRIRSDFVLAGKRSGYQRLYTDTAFELVSLLLHTAVENPPTAFDAIRTVCMLGSDASHFVDLILDALQSNVTVTIHVSYAISSALHGIGSHYPLLRKMIRSSLRKMAAAGNMAAEHAYVFFCNVPS